MDYAFKSVTEGYAWCFVDFSTPLLRPECYVEEIVEIGCHESDRPGRCRKSCKRVVHCVPAAAALDLSLDVFVHVDTRRLVDRPEVDIRLLQFIISRHRQASEICDPPSQVSE